MFIFDKYVECTCSLCDAIRDLDKKPIPKINQEHKDLVRYFLDNFTKIIKEMLKEEGVKYLDGGMVPFDKSEHIGMGSGRIAFSFGKNRDLFDVEHVKNNIGNEMPKFLSEMIYMIKESYKSNNIYFCQAPHIIDCLNTIEDEKNDFYSESNMFCRVWLNFSKKSAEPYICIDSHIRKVKKNSKKSK